MPPEHARARPDLLSVDFAERPFTVAWELTRACALACRHCRAEAQPRRDPHELSTEEVRRGIDELAELAPPVLVLTGGDPLMRPDLDAIVAHAVWRGFAVSVSPTTTALTTAQRLVRLRDLGVQLVHVSLDGASPETHDAFRGFPGTFARAMHTLRSLAELGMGIQVGTTVTRHNVGELPAMVPLLRAHGIRIWSLFFLVPTGRGRAEDMLDVDQAEQTWEWLAALGEREPFAVRTTAAPQFRRTMLRRQRRARAVSGGDNRVRLTGGGYQIEGALGGVRTRGVNDGKGFLFIDHRGNICPSGFLQLPAGNLHTDRIADVYRSSELFRVLRDPERLRGRCGRCRYAELCGGSRARAYALSGSYLDEDPLCGLSETAIALTS